jgi:hypothetical protein
MLRLSAIATNGKATIGVSQMTLQSSRSPSFIAPDRLYTLKGFQIASGVSATRIREAKRKGVVLPTLEVGRRKFVGGADAISYLYELARLTAEGSDS